MKRRARPRVVVLGGAGAMGRIVARDLRDTSQGTLEVVVADRDPAPARSLGLEAVATDVTSPRRLASTLRGAALTVAALPYRWNLEAMRGALEAGCHYLDLGGLYHTTLRQLRLAASFRRAGLMAILGVGSSPGITNVLAALASRELERVSDVHVQVGNVDLTRWRERPLLGFGYSPDTLLDELVLPAAVFRAGRVRFVPALDPGESSLARFPAPIGERRLDATLHSELATLPRFFRRRGVAEITFRQSFEPDFLEKARFVVELGLAEKQPLGALAVAPRAVLAALLGRLPPAVPLGPRDAHEVLRVVVAGEREGRPVRVVAECRAGPSSGQGVGPDADTGAPPSIVAQLLLATRELPPRPGVWAPEDAIPIAPFVRELERRGLRVACSRRSTASPPARVGRRHAENSLETP